MNLNDDNNYSICHSQMCIYWLISMKLRNCAWGIKVAYVIYLCNVFIFISVSQSYVKRRRT